MIERDVAILVCSRGREAVLARLLDDLEGGFGPALAAGGLSHAVVVYAQGYPAAYLDGLADKFTEAVAAQTLVVIPSQRAHGRIGDVVQTAISRMHDGVRYRLAMVMDDDSVYTPNPAVDDNLRTAARAFIASGHRAYSIKLGDGEELAFEPFVDPAGPIMPFKEKMLWVARPVLEEVLRTPRFAELSIGEDAVIAGLAWLADPEACLAVRGLATFRHLGYEPAPDVAHDDAKGGYAELMDYDGPRPDLTHGKYDAALKSGVTPHHLMPEVFVGEDHPHYIYNGIRAEVIARLRAAGRTLGGG